MSDEGNSAGGSHRGTVAECLSLVLSEHLLWTCGILEQFRSQVPVIQAEADAELERRGLSDRWVAEVRFVELDGEYARWIRGLSRVFVRRRTEPAPVVMTDDDLRFRAAVFMRAHAEVAAPQPGECDCPPGVPVLATKPDHCPACGRHRENWREEP